MCAAFLNKGERQYLTAELKERTEEILDALNSLKQACRCWMQENVSFEQLRDVLHDVDGTNKIKMLDDRKDEVVNAKDHFSLISIVYHFTSWYNYGLLKHVTMRSADAAKRDKEEIEKLFKSYENKLHQFYRQFVFECPAPSDKKITAKLKYFVLKIDKPFEELTFGDYNDHIHYNLHKIFGIGAHVLHLRLIRKGCTEVVYLLPKCLYEAIFPLSEQKLEQLSQLGVMTAYIDTLSQVS